MQCVWTNHFSAVMPPGECQAILKDGVHLLPRHFQAYALNVDDPACVLRHNKDAHAPASTAAAISFFAMRQKKPLGHEKLFQTQNGVRNCFPTPVLADRSKGQVLTFFNLISSLANMCYSLFNCALCSPKTAGLCIF